MTGVKTAYCAKSSAEAMNCWSRGIGGAPEVPRPLRVKAGFDPCARPPSPGIPYFSTNCGTFQDLGHHVIFLIGDFRCHDRKSHRKNIPVPAFERAGSGERAYLPGPGVQDSRSGKNRSGIQFPPGSTPWGCGHDPLSGPHTVARMFGADDFCQALQRRPAHRVARISLPSLPRVWLRCDLRSDIEIGGTDQNSISRSDGNCKTLRTTAPVRPHAAPVGGARWRGSRCPSPWAIMWGSVSRPRIFGKIVVSDELMWRYDLLSFLPQG